jgi:putative FmdB family regulatory protein
MECAAAFEVSHSMSETPAVECPACGSSKVQKQISAPFIISGGTLEQQRQRDRAFVHQDKRRDLQENYGVHKVTPLTRREGFDQIYKGIKSAGSQVKEQMQAEREKNDAKRTAKHKEWRKKAEKRAPEKARMKKEQKKKEEAAKRRIVVTKGK